MTYLFGLAALILINLTINFNTENNSTEAILKSLSSISFAATEHTTTVVCKDVPEGSYNDQKGFLHNARHRICLASGCPFKYPFELGSYTDGTCTFIVN